ncbi:hypothetical protein C4D60_Mb04t07510 [Musa balbisiana]|uniref:AB hydrolase-1 domain-containing protein n=1 Tax=Musa balbisiana TaxID=52838 RepID=A0A4S8KAE8_MUSBA|nr:hypothetical protein C4D60_Mb04t07510 [Musa balbisiana]
MASYQGALNGVTKETGHDTVAEMMNWVEVQKTLLHWLARRAGLRQQTVELESGTIMNFWVPKAKVITMKKGSACNSREKEEEKKKKKKPAVVLVHGFAMDGIMTWQFQVGSLVDRYDVYVPDLLFFGGSATETPDRSPAYQADCLAAALGRLRVRRCTVVGFSYGGVVSFKLAERWPDLVSSLVVSGSTFAMTDSLSSTIVKRLGVSSLAEFLLPVSVKGVKALFSAATYRKLWFPNCFHRDFLEVMFTNRKERAEMLEALVISNQEASVPQLQQERILLLWGESDNIFNLELVKNIKAQLGEKVTLKTIENAGHLVHLERPCVYNRCLKEFLVLIHPEVGQSLHPHL